MVPHPPFPMKSSLACAAFCCAACACRTLLSSTGSESPCRGGGTPLQRSATSFSKGSVQQQARKTGVSPRCVSQKGRQTSAVAQELLRLDVMGYAGLSKGVHVCAIPRSYEEMFELARMLEAAQLAGRAWANVSPFLSRVVVVVRVCFRISVRQLAFWTYSVRELGGGCPCSLLRCPQSFQVWKELAGHILPSSSHCSDPDDLFCAPELSASPNIRARAVFSYFLLFFKLPTGRIIICLPCRFGSNSSSQPGAGSLLLLLLGELCHRLPPGSDGGWSLFRHALCWAAQGAACPGAGLMLGFWEGESSSTWSEPGASHTWNATPAQQVNRALPHAVLTGPLSSISFHIFFFLMSFKDSCLSD